jgi:hypothetical protein
MLVRSGFSFHAAIGSAKEVVSRLQEVGATTAAFADTCSTYGFVKLTKAAEAAGLRVVYGVELLVVEHLGEKRLGLDRWVFLAKDALRPLHDLIYLATKGRRVPSLSYPEALAAPGLVKIASEAAVPALMESLDQTCTSACRRPAIAARSKPRPTRAIPSWPCPTIAIRGPGTASSIA